MEEIPKGHRTAFRGKRRLMMKIMAYSDTEERTQVCPAVRMINT